MANERAPLLEGCPLPPDGDRHSKDWIGYLQRSEQGSVFVEYLLLLTIVGIGVIAGLATVRSALIAELLDLANAIASIT